MFSLGIPMALTQLIQFSIHTVDVLMIGRLGAEPLAASSLGLVIFFMVYIIGTGPAMAVAPMVSQALGASADNETDVRRSVRMGLWAILLGYPVALMVFAFTTPLALMMGQPEGAAALAGPYVLALAPGLPFAFGVIILRNFLAAIDRTRVPLLIIMATTIFNTGLNYLLIYGNAGFPRMELVGAGLASATSHFLGFLSLGIYIYKDEVARRFDLFSGVLRSDWPRLRELLQLGWPITVTTMFEGMLFNACVLLTGRIGVDEMAAFQIALNVSALIFMVSLGMSMAGGVRVGLAAGGGDRAGVLRASLVTIGICTVFMSVCAIIVAAAPRLIAGLYLSLEDGENANLLLLTEYR